MILILSETKEPNTANIIDLLNYMNEPWFRVNGENIPKYTKFDFNNTSSKSCIYDESGINITECIYLKDVKSVWYRRMGMFDPDPVFCLDTKRFIATECHTVYEGLSAFLPNVQWMNDIWNEKKANNPFVQIHSARSAGLNVPDYIVTQNKKHAKNFYTEYKGKVITKVISNVSVSRFGLSMIFTSQLNEESIRHFDNVNECPTLLQEKVSRLLELRITIVGNEIFCGATEPEYDSKYGVDIRSSNLGEIPYYIYELPENIKTRLIQFMEMLGLAFGTIDMIVTPEGDYVFLEVNVGGQWEWIEGATGLPINRAISNWLINRGEN